MTDPSIFVIFGGTGDLSQRKLLPALAHLTREGQLNENTHILAVGRSDKSDEDFRNLARQAMADAGVSTQEVESLCGSRMHYQATGEGTREDYQALKKRLQKLDSENQVGGNHTFYMALPPRAFPSTVRGLGEVGLHQSKGFNRLVVEKPFGHDLQSAKELNDLIHTYFDESQVYRIDHYLGKETVQNLLVFRLANALIESNWNRERVSAVQITVAESLGVGSRASYYDKSGAMRDMVQNHLTQLLTLVAMEVPTRFDAEAIRFEKIKVLRSIAPINPDDVVLGQYGEGTVNGKTTRAYHQEDNIPDDSSTETFVAMRLFVDTWRWHGVPFYLRTGKRLPRKTTKIAIQFQDVPVRFFQAMGCEQSTTDVLIITLQPNEGFTFHLDIKRPGNHFSLHRIPLRFEYASLFEQVPEAYQTLLLDILTGDQTLFVHGDEVEESWRVYTPLLESPPQPVPYGAGTWGPEEADWLKVPESALWQTGDA